MPPRDIRLHDTRSGAVIPLRPRDPGRVGIYACGPTVYSRIHIGNARPFVVFSLLGRFLEHEGLQVTLVINVTDVNDKIYAAAAAAASAAAAATAVAGDDQQPRAGCPSAELAAEMTARYRADTDALGLGRPDHEPLASETIGAIVAYIERLIVTGHAYASGGDVFFRVRSDPAYGSLSHRRIEDMDQGEDGADADAAAQRKEDPLDFALWKARKKADEDTSWDPRDYGAATAVSEWAPGRPGWHIECSAMAEQVLGVGFDIHGGGSDLVFPHHENEAAQTRAARGAELARIWMHNGMIQLTGAKMAKSAGNIALLCEVLDTCGAGTDPAHAAHTVVMYLIGGHYRQPLAFSAAELQDAERRVGRIREALRRLVPGAPSPADMAHHRDAFFDALADDFNTPKALAALFEWVREANRRGEAVGDGDLREMLGTIGFEQLQPLEAVGDLGAIDPEAVQLLEQREAARRERDFPEADRLREEINARGWEIRDGAAGPELIPR